MPFFLSVFLFVEYLIIETSTHTQYTNYDTSLRKYSQMKEGQTNMKYKFTTSLNKELVDELKIQAIKEHRSVSSILEQLITDYLNDIN